MQGSNTYRIICFDGGGVRGALMLALMLRLDGLVPGWRSRVDLFAGTSVGALIALGLAAGYEPSELLARFRVALPDVFRDTWWDDVRDVGKAFGADYDSSGLIRTVQDLFGNRRFGELGGHVMVPTLRLHGKDGARPKFFHNLPGSDSDAGARAADVAAYSAAAPVFFPTIEGHADGGLVANHPGVAAVTLTQDSRNVLPARPTLSQIRLLSFGAGRDPVSLPKSDGDWGWIRWARPLIRLMVEASVDVPDYQCHQLLGDRYHRLAPAFEPGDGPALDQVAALRDLERLGFEGMTDQVHGAAAWLKDRW